MHLMCNAKSLIMVSAWSNNHQLVLGQVAVKQKSNEIKAIPVLLERALERTDIAKSNGESPEAIDLEGAIITTDAMGTQTAIAQQIQDSSADYILTLKANHPILAENARDWFKRHQHKADETKVHTTELICEAGHHRIEKRRFFAVRAEQVFDPRRIQQWAGLQTLIVEQSSRQLWNKTTHSTRFFLSSLAADFAHFPDSIRSAMPLASDCALRSTGRIRARGSREPVTLVSGCNFCRR